MLAMRLVRPAAWGIVIAILASFVYAVSMPLAKGADNMWVLNSPDAAAVQVAARSFAQTGSLTWEPAGAWSAESSAPRSFTRVGQGWAPGSYAGLPTLYGLLAALVGLWPLVWLTPLLGGLGVWLMYVLVERWRGHKVGLAAAALLAVTPAYWYASSQPFTPSIPFIVLLMAAVVGFTGRRASSFVLGGLTLGLALAIRPHEALWVLPAAIIMLVGRITWRQFGMAALGLIIPIAAAVWIQLMTYGHLLGSGYSLASVGDGGPFSFDVRVVATNVWRYIVELHGYLLALAVVGAVATLRGVAGNRRYLIAFIVVAVGLLAIYGGYLVHDSPGIAEPTIGNSQVRYLLPLLVLLIPLAAGLASRIAVVGTVAAVALAAVISFNIVVTAPGDGTLAVHQTLMTNASIQQQVLAATNNDTLIVAGRLDKLFVGYRPTAFVAAGGLADQLRIGRQAAVLGGQGLSAGLAIGRRLDLHGGLVLQELLVAP
jgi:hypothetical protein